MTFQRKDINVNTSTANGVNHAVLIVDAPAPLALEIAFQWLWFAYTSKRMFLYIIKQVGDALHDFYITRLLPIITIFTGFFKQNYFHRSSIAMGCRLPAAISLSPWRTISSSSAIGITLLVCFCAAIRLSARTAFFIKASSPDMACRAPKSSVLICICAAVITAIFIFSAAKINNILLPTIKNKKNI